MIIIIVLLIPDIYTYYIYIGVCLGSWSIGQFRVSMRRLRGLLRFSPAVLLLPRSLWREKRSSFPVLEYSWVIVDCKRGTLLLFGTTSLSRTWAAVSLFTIMNRQSTQYYIFQRLPNRILTIIFVLSTIALAVLILEPLYFNNSELPVHD